MPERRTARLAPVVGIHLARPTKEDLAVAVADRLGIERPTMSTGSTVVSEVLPRIFTAVTGEDPRARNTYEMTAAILQRLGLTYDPDSDTSEHRGRTGGGTVTARAFSKMLTAVTGMPRFFAVRAENSRPSMHWERLASDAFRAPLGAYRSMSLEDAGPGSPLLFHQHEPLASTNMNHSHVRGWSHRQSSRTSPRAGTTSGGSSSSTTERWPPPLRGRWRTCR